MRHGQRIEVIGRIRCLSSNQAVEAAEWHWKIVPTTRSAASPGAQRQALTLLLLVASWLRPQLLCAALVNSSERGLSHTP